MVCSARRRPGASPKGWLSAGHLWAQRFAPLTWTGRAEPRSVLPAISKVPGARLYDFRLPLAGLKAPARCGASGTGAGAAVPGSWHRRTSLSRAHAHAQKVGGDRMGGVRPLRAHGPRALDRARERAAQGAGPNGAHGGGRRRGRRRSRRRRSFPHTLHTHARTLPWHRAARVTFGVPLVGRMIA